MFTLGLVCNEAAVTDRTAVGGNPLDVALWEAPDAAAAPSATTGAWPSPRSTTTVAASRSSSTTATNASS